jgi:hypothetical protein
MKSISQLSGRASPRLDPWLFELMLRQMDSADTAQNSSINHHVDGLDYLCLSRSKGLTIKLYLMNEPRNPNNTFLVNPHSHRYAFSSIVLAGSLDHLRFTKVDIAPDCEWDQVEYCADSKARRTVGRTGLRATVEPQSVGGQYFVDPHEIHTLQVHHGAPLLLGLAQFADKQALSDLFLPSADCGHLALPQTRRMTPDDADRVRVRMLEVLSGAAQ